MSGELRTDGKNCFEECYCAGCSARIRIIYPDSFKSDKGEWPEIRAVCSHCVANSVPFKELGILYEDAEKYVTEPDGRQHWVRYNFETKEYEPRR